MNPSRPRTTERGATASEYALLAFGIAVAIAVAAFVLGDDVRDFYQSAVDALTDLAR